MEMHALIEEITALLAKIKSGEATLGELEAFVAATSQLNERAIILRYKAMEANVYGRPIPPVSVSEAPQPVKEEIEPVIEAQENHPEPEEEPSFDLFGMSTEADEDEEEPAPFELIDDTSEEIIVEEQEPFTEVAAFSADTVETPENEPVVSEPVSAAPIENTLGLHAIYGKLNSNDGTLASRLMSVRLETLKGAFGFNERLQIIQELFDGSSDEFNKLIDQIETISSKEDARSLVSSYANKYHWDADSQLAIELVQKVERKYA